MNRKIVFITIFTILLMACLGGCKEKEIVVAKNQDEPDFTIKEGIEIDWDQVMDDCEDYLNPDDYPYGSYLDFAVHEETASVELIWPLLPECPKEEAIEYAKAYIRAFNDACSTQDFGIAMSTEDYYGGYWDKNDIDLQVFWEKDIMEPDNYLINQVIPAGSNAEVELQAK